MAPEVSRPVSCLWSARSQYRPSQHCQDQAVRSTVEGTASARFAANEAGDVRGKV